MQIPCKNCGKVFESVEVSGDEDSVLCNDCFVKKNALTRREEAEIESHYDIEGLD